MFAPGGLLPFLLVTGVLFAATGSAQIDVPQPDWRLPTSIIPLAYSIHLTTNVHSQSDFTFGGDVNITLSVIKAAAAITLHAKNLTIDQVSVWPKDNRTAIMYPVARRFVGSHEQLQVFINRDDGGELVAGVEYVLRLQYSGELRDDQYGFYRTSYVDELGERRWLATTQFASIDARHAFPCFDEPALRAPFSLRITHGTGYRALSNMPVADVAVVSADGLMSTTTFETTPSMPTYLLAFTVSDYRCTAEKRDSAASVPQRVCTRPPVFNSTEFALNTGLQVLAAYEQYFGIAYDLPKLDQVAILEFPLGAMENWGLVSYREASLLYDPATGSTFEDQLRSGRIIAHEYAHQWFGNLVTPKWWSYIWLSEGLATLFENVATDWLHPEWRVLEDFVFSRLQRVMVYDVSELASPMTKDVRTLDEISIEGLFDDIPYGKAGCVLRMFQHALTDRVFKAGLIQYLNKLKYSAATELDLFEALDTNYPQSGLSRPASVTNLMSSWTRQLGFPLLIVTRDYRTGELFLQQQPYTAHNRSGSEPTANQTWWIPCNYASSSWADFNSTAPQFWFNTPFAFAQPAAEQLKPTDWLLFNKLQTGYYRVQYDAENYRLLSEGLRKCRQCFHVTNRAQLLDDAFDLARSGRLSYATPLELGRFLADETEYLPWAAAFRGLELVDRLYGNSEWFGEYEKYMSGRLANAYNHLGLVAADGEPMSSKLGRNLITHWACRYGHNRCTNETSEALRSSITNHHQPLHQDHETAIICGALMQADSQPLFDAVYQRLKDSRDSEQRQRLIDGLVCSRNPWNLLFMLMDSVNETVFWSDAGQRFRVWERIVLGGRTGAMVARDFMLANWYEVAERYGPSKMNTIAMRMAEVVGTYEQLQVFNQFVNDVHHHLKLQTMRMASASALANLNWMHRNAEVIHDWIERNSAANASISALLIVAGLLFIGILV